MDNRVILARSGYLLPIMSWPSWKCACPGSPRSRHVGIAGISNVAFHIGPSA